MGIVLVKTKNNKNKQKTPTQTNPSKKTPQTPHPNQPKPLKQVCTSKPKHFRLIWESGRGTGTILKSTQTATYSMLSGPLLPCSFATSKILGLSLSFSLFREGT